MNKYNSLSFCFHEFVSFPTGRKTVTKQHKRERKTTRQNDNLFVLFLTCLCCLYCKPWFWQFSEFYFQRRI